MKKVIKLLLVGLSCGIIFNLLVSGALPTGVGIVMGVAVMIVGFISGYYFIIKSQDSRMRYDAILMTVIFIGLLIGIYSGMFLFGKRNLTFADQFDSFRNKYEKESLALSKLDKSNESILGNAKFELENEFAAFKKLYEKDSLLMLGLDQRGNLDLIQSDLQSQLSTLQRDLKRDCIVFTPLHGKELKSALLNSNNAEVKRALAISDDSTSLEIIKSMLTNNCE
jgi:hypothetical protein